MPFAVKPVPQAQTVIFVNIDLGFHSEFYLTVIKSVIKYRKMISYFFKKVNLYINIIFTNTKKCDILYFIKKLIQRRSLCYPRYILPVYRE